ncbi:MAG: sulfatase-like hydrolase/transferase, partial [Leptospiraceae bacterium]|nr:sulfatase-like hydrolase/transferase [Leptospiraceae bacterium]
MKFKFYQSIQNSFSLKLSLYSGLAYFFILTIYRILFFIYNHNTDEKTNTTEIIKAFLFGIRFDLSTISIIVIFILAISFAGNFKYFFKYQKQLTFIPLIILEWMVLHLGADILYFKNSNKHLGYEAIVFLGKDFTVIFRSALNADLFFILGIFITLIGAGLIFFKGLNTLRTTITSNTNYIQSISHNVLFICILVVLIRGGFQKSPISPGNAAFSKNFFLNNLALNGVFTVLSDLKWKNSPNIQKIKIEEAILIARNEISYPESQFISSRYPILRKTKAKPNTTPPNIVLVILESWTGKFINSKLPDFQSKEITPIFNKLIQKGVYFQNFFSTGGRTSNGLFAILTSIPDRPGFSTIHSQNALANVGGLGNVLKYAGYDSIFIYGGELDFENIKPLVKHWGYDTLY